MRNRKKSKYLLLLGLLLLISVGYAVISTQLKINGTARVSKQSWKVYWDENSILVAQGSTSAAQPTVSDGDDGSEDAKVTWSVDLTVPSDFYEFTIDAVNDGSIDAMITNVAPIVPQDLPEYIKYSITYADGVPIAENHLLPKKSGNTETREKYKVRVYYDETLATAETVNAIPDGGKAYEFKLNITYGQATDAAIDKPFLYYGKYFRLVPDASTYTVLSSDTGYVDSATGDPIDQTITPSELTLWRVIDVHQDGSVDAVSEYVSSSSIYIYGTRGYANYAGVLQSIASQYAKSGYTIGTRIMGYNGQTLEIQDTSTFDGTNSNNPPTTESTPAAEGDGAEYAGGAGGDTLYIKDTRLVADVYKSDTETYGDSGLKAYEVGTNTAKKYYLPSRNFLYHTPPFIYYMITLAVKDNGDFAVDVIIQKVLVNWNTHSTAAGIRPIITVKGDVAKSGGTGTKTDPYTLE